MEEIKVGEYIRVKEPYGEIYKVIGRDKEEILLVDTSGNNRVPTGYVKKHSPNIIDLIEVGDYVNGYKVRATYLEGERPYIKFERLNHIRLYEKDIESVATKEQFNSIKYVIGE